jgi:hypothetical protein
MGPSIFGHAFHSNFISVCVSAKPRRFDCKGSWKGFAPYAKGKTAILQWDEEAAHDRRERAIAFLRQTFGLESIDPEKLFAARLIKEDPDSAKDG